MLCPWSCAPSLAIDFLTEIGFRGGLLLVVIFVKAMGDSESKSNESIMRAICDKLAGGVAELQNEFRSD